MNLDNFDERLEKLNKLLADREHDIAMLEAEIMDIKKEVFCGLAPAANETPTLVDELRAVRADVLHGHTDVLGIRGHARQGWIHSTSLLQSACMEGCLHEAPCQPEQEQLIGSLHALLVPSLHQSCASPSEQIGSTQS